MSDWNVDVYRNRERQWRAEAWRMPPGYDRDACLTLAEGYARLIEIIEREQDAVNTTISVVQRRQSFA